MMVDPLWIIPWFRFPPTGQWSTRKYPGCSSTHPQSLPSFYLLLPLFYRLCNILSLCAVQLTLKANMARLSHEFVKGCCMLNLNSLLFTRMRILQSLALLVNFPAVFIMKKNKVIYLGCCYHTPHIHTCIYLYIYVYIRVYTYLFTYI